MAKQTKTEFTSLNIKGVITSMSNRSSEEYDTKVKNKTAYITVSNPKDEEKLEAFGLTKYTSEDGADFFVLKTSSTVDIYENDDPQPVLVKTYAGTIDVAESFKTKEGVEVTLNLVKSVKNKQEFKRLKAVLVESLDDIEKIEPQNPFAK